MPILWDAEGRGYGRVENPAARITEKTINAVLERARASIALPTKVRAHVAAKHSYCTNWIDQYGKDEFAMRS